MRNMMEKPRTWLAASSLRSVSAPYLPFGLIWSALLVAFTDLVVILLAQPAAYWMDRERAIGVLPFLRSLLSGGVAFYALVGILYLLLLWIILTVLTRSIALIVWMPVSMMHLSHVLFWASEEVGLTERGASDPMFGPGIQIVSALFLGLVLSRILLSSRRGIATSGRLRAVLGPAASILWIVLLLAAVTASAVGPRTGWIRLEPEHTPGRRGLAAVAYDTQRHRAVLFGGKSEWMGNAYFYENDTWEWDGNDWNEVHPETIPPARVGHMMAYDEKRGVIVMFGGEERTSTYMLSDTWEWDGKDWRQVSPESFPQGRRGGQLFYDPQTEKIVLCGGFYYGYPDKVFTPLDDVWAWDGTRWEYVTRMPQTLIITNPNVAFDPVRKRPILFNYSQFMIWEDGQWNEIMVDPGPVPRFGTWLAADPASGRMLLFGGIDNKIQRNDSWLLNGDSWQELHPDMTPGVRDAHIMFYDPVRNSFILYGGMSTYALDDMWEFPLP